MIWTNFVFRTTQGWIGAFWSIWLELALWVLQCLIFLWPYGEKIIFLEFSGYGTQIEGGQNMMSIATPLYLTSRGLWDVSNKESDSVFRYPKIVCGNSFVCGSRPVLLDKVELLQKNWKNSLTWSTELGKKLWFFFFLVGQRWSVALVYALGILGGPTIESWFSYCHSLLWLGC